MNETFHRLGTDNLSNNNFHRLLYDDNQDFDIYKEIDLDSSYYSPDQFCEKFTKSKNISALSNGGKNKYNLPSLTSAHNAVLTK